ncbi:hypothetical protein N0V88_005658 [Collariella sp. IMI 366227]|nr:hypothetical protein N0V88_005658 [Collariella sp. IMI 366227]
MASPTVVAPQVNGVAPSPRQGSPAASTNSSSTKRKRESSDDNDTDLGAPDQAKPPPYDTSNPSILKRPLLDFLPDGEPSSKRAKSEEGSKPVTIATKVAQGTYEALDDLVTDIVESANSQVKELESATTPADGSLLTKTIALRAKALELYRQELAYPNLPRPSLTKPISGQVHPPNTGNLVLTAVGAAPTIRPLFTSLQRGAATDKLAQAILPRGVSLTKVLLDPPVSAEKGGRILTLGELFPSPRNLPPLQPPKAPKTTTKSNVLTFYHPELTEKSKYPRSELGGRQALRRPSAAELEISEMEALFRGAFSSFAPSKDDSGAIVPSGQVSRVWWQRVGQRNFAKMIDAEELEANREDSTAADSAMDLDEERIKDAIENWDDSAIDPSLDHVLGKKSDEEKEVDDLLEEVSDLIETLASYQRNRNLTLPTSQDRYSADPVNGDMLRNGNLSHQPSEEETLTYETLKAQLSLIIQTLPPYAVARLNSDKLAELAVSTRIEIRSDEYRGVMEEDEPARLARVAAQQQAAASNQRQAHRTPSVSGPYANQQYQPQFTPSARPVGNAQHFPQTPVRPQQHMYPRGPSSVPIPQHHQVQPRPVPQTQFRPQMYAPQLAKAQGPYGHQNMPQQYAASPSQPRMPQHANYNMGQPGTPNPRFPPQYQQHQQIHPHPQPSPHQQMAQLPQHPGQPYPYTNGGPHASDHLPKSPTIPTPTAPPQHPHQQQHQQIARAPTYVGSPGPGMQPIPRQQYAASPAPAG